MKEFGLNFSIAFTAMMLMSITTLAIGCFAVWMYPQWVIIRTCISVSVFIAFMFSINEAVKE